MGNSANYTPSLFRSYSISIIVAGLLFTTLPFVALAFYNHPSLDDILDVSQVQELGFWQAQKFFYFSHTGRYTTTVLLALANPLYYGHWEASWWWVALVFILGTLLMLRYGIGAILHLRTRDAWLMAGIMLSLWLTYAPGLAEGLYWFTGAYTYIVAVWLLVAWMGALAHYAHARQNNRHKRLRLMIVAALTLAVAGTTEPLVLPFVLTLLAAAGLSWYLGRGRIVCLLAVLAIIGSTVSFLAPGNFMRMSSMGSSFGVIKTLVYSAGTSAYLLLTWIGNPVLLALSVLLLPALYRIGQQQQQLVVRMLAKLPTGWVFFILIGLLIAANCPAYYASGTGLPLRARSMLYLIFLISWFGLLLTWCCRQAARQHVSPIVSSTNPMYSLWVAVLVLFFFADYNMQTRAAMLGQGSNNALRAYRQWLSGDAAGYDAEQRARYQAFASDTPPVIITPLQHRPDLLVSFDIIETSNPDFLKRYRNYLAE
ncbi:hypothetical protein MON38_13245 [Hymenobacter sp. DH14]|uniref:Uncharacterized protein n=1 Tax=Hymenobacter cyanobacteriorum TaxID=2926463 RepID=A0A9X2AFN7_9BACT|nr:hypothetical protein [Hymenobacter cyanobacteriorum]MCI1188391.1 hypothetical protein [Hymenobacter cyanobacteriorum]